MSRFLRCYSRVLILAAWAAGAAAGCMAAVPACAEPARSLGQSLYVPVYSHILFGDRAATFNLAATLSIRNTDAVHSLVVTAADYHGSDGRLLKKHLDKPVVLKPLAATEVYVTESDTSGGLGASFIVRWTAAQMITPPVVECLMIGARSGLGISVLSQGRVTAENRK